MASIFSYSDYRDWLRAELSRRLSQNASYSQGAFARDLGLRPSRLCEILQRKQGLSADYARRLAARLALTSQESEYFIDLVVSRHGRSRAARQAAEMRMSQKHGFLHPASPLLTKGQCQLSLNIPEDRIHQVLAMIRQLADSLQSMSKETAELKLTIDCTLDRVGAPPSDKFCH